MVDDWVLVIAAIAILASAGLAYLARRKRARLATRHHALSHFATTSRELEGKFLEAAAATGKPRGLRWMACQLGEPLFAVATATGDLVALAPATISFEAVEGGGMEDVEAVGNLRSATAVFVHRGGAWTTDGRILFNLEPHEAMTRLGAMLEPVAFPSPAA
jgi:hypothetical protein